VHWLSLATETVLSPEGLPVKAFGIVGDVTARKQQDEQRALLVAELNHRVKNVLATVQAIAQQTFQSPGQTSAHQMFQSRLGTLAQAHSLLASENWRATDLASIVTAALSPFQRGENIRLKYEGEAETIRLSAQAAVSIAMLLHELCTNAAKYGALSVATGTVVLVWRGASEGSSVPLSMRWQESGGPRVQPRARLGFGSRIIEGALSADLHAHTKLTFDPAGVTCTMEARVETG
jgi:two-component sensor histidine kinase